MKHDRRAGRLLIFTLGVLLALTGQTWPLNPLVTRNPQPAGPVPPECEEGLAPAPMPRVIVAEVPPAEEVRPASIPPAPPSRTLRNTLEEAHAALVRNDRPAFDAALANARLIVRDYPPGGERTNAEEAVRAYEDAAFLWNAQFTSPFFDENSEAYARVSRYPGYAEAVRRGVFTDDSQRRFYPAAESRDFLTRVAAERLNRLGIRTTTPPTRVARAERPRASAPSVAAPPTYRRSTSATPRRSPSRRAASNVPKSRKSATPAISAPASPDPQAPARAVADSAPAAPPAAAPTPAAPASSPVAEGQPVEDVPDATPAPAGTAPADTAPADTALTDTALTDTATPDTAPAAQAPATAKRRSMVVPALLILIGLGVLFVLFRVSR